ncbi:MAG: biotin/lipoyl-binding protein [Candidatus Thorarchaeota archaeon]|nr:biotin/lipoyl-binding protein [Candidatus Thorarchaeota archaeon]
MSPEYKVTLDEKLFEVEVKMLDEGGVLVVKVGDQSFTTKPILTEDGTWIVNDLATDYTVKILKRAGKAITLEINGEEREIEWERQRKVETVKKTAGAAQGGSRVAGGIYPPMPGKITEVLVNVGDKVKSGDTICILEAMKMFNELKANSSGSVKEINVDVGTMVTTADLLILIE